MTPYTLQTRVRAQLSDRVAVELLIDTLEEQALTFDVPIPLDSPLLPLFGVVAMGEAINTALVETLIALPDDSLRVILRIVKPGALALPSLPRRKTSDLDDRAYLEAGLSGISTMFEILFSTLDRPDSLHGLTTILIDPDLTAAERVDAVLALDPRAADWASYLLAEGADPAITDRFYLREGRGSDTTHVTLIDRDTNHVVITYPDKNRIDEVGWKAIRSELTTLSAALCKRPGESVTHLDDWRQAHIALRSVVRDPWILEQRPG